MKMALRALAIGAAVEALCALPFAFGGFGPCGPSGPLAIVGMVLHVPGLAVGAGLETVAAVPERAALAAGFAAQVALFSAIAYYGLRVRASLARRREGTAT
jgi:hypothetical protein